jgi:hypothetical protein
MAMMATPTLLGLLLLVWLDVRRMTPSCDDKHRRQAVCPAAMWRRRIVEKDVSNLSRPTL